MTMAASVARLNLRRFGINTTTKLCKRHFFGRGKLYSHSINSKTRELHRLVKITNESALNRILNLENCFQRLCVRSYSSSSSDNVSSSENETTDTAKDSTNVDPTSSDKSDSLAENLKTSKEELKTETITATVDDVQTESILTVGELKAEGTKAQTISTIGQAVSTAEEELNEESVSAVDVDLKAEDLSAAKDELGTEICSNTEEELKAESLSISKEELEKEIVVPSQDELKTESVLTVDDELKKDAEQTDKLTAFAIDSEDRNEVITDHLIQNESVTTIDALDAMNKRKEGIGSSKKKTRKTRADSDVEVPSWPTNQEVEFEDEPDVLYRRIDLDIKSIDRAVLMSYCGFLRMAAAGLDVKLKVKPIPKSKVSRYSVLKSSHVYKKHVRQYERKTFMLHCQVHKVTGSTASVYLEYIQRNLPEGVAMEVTKHEIQMVPMHLVRPIEQVEPTKNAENVTE